MANPKTTDDCADDFTVVGDGDTSANDSPPNYSPFDSPLLDASLLDGPPLDESPVDEAASASISAFPEMADAIKCGDGVLKALSDAVDRLWNANHDPSVTIPLKNPAGVQRQGTGTGDPAPYVSPAQFTDRVRSMTLTECAAYSCCLDLAQVLLEFRYIFAELPEEGGRTPANLQNLFSALANIVVAAYHQWTAIRVRLGKGASYSSIATMFNVYISHCKTQTLRAISGQSQEPILNNHTISDHLYNCFKAVRGHTSLEVTKLWAATLETVLPLFVKACTTPYRKSCSTNLSTAYSYHVEDIIEERLRYAGERAEPATPTKYGRANSKTTVMRYDEDEAQALRYTNPWAAFVLYRYG